MSGWGGSGGGWKDGEWSTGKSLKSNFRGSFKLSIIGLQTQTERESEGIFIMEHEEILAKEFIGKRKA
jgi:hypothetical protein